jgi:hypothetical protein
MYFHDRSLSLPVASFEIWPHTLYNPRSGSSLVVRAVLAQTFRTAVYGPVRTVVWQGSAGDCRPYADQTCYTTNGRLWLPTRSLLAVRELPLLHCKIVSCAGNAVARQQTPVAVQQNRFQARNCRCYAANPFPAQESPLLRCKSNSRAARVFYRAG